MLAMRGGRPTNSEGLERNALSVKGLLGNCLLGLCRCGGGEESGLGLKGSLEGYLKQEHNNLERKEVKKKVTKCNAEASKCHD